MSRVAFLGLGAMGSRMALNLLAAGHQVTVYNRSLSRSDPLTSKGATLAGSPRDAAEGSDVVISMVRDDDASRSIWLDPATGALFGLHDRSIAVESSTLSLAWVKELAAAVIARRAAFLDAPVVGSRPQAEAKQLVFLVGGNAAALDRVRPLLSAMGSAIHHVGGTAHGAALKLAVNTLFGIQLSALGEILGLMRRCGLPERQVAELMGGLPVMSPAAKVAAEAMVERRFAPLFPINLVEKDFQYALLAAEQAAANTPLTRAAHATFREAMSMGYASDNIVGVAQLFD